MVTIVSIKSCQKTEKLSERQPNFFTSRVKILKPYIVTFLPDLVWTFFGQKLSERLKKQQKPETHKDYL